MGCICMRLPSSNDLYGKERQSCGTDNAVGDCCRERKKATAQNLQGAVAALSERLEQLSTAQQLNAQLRERNAALRQAVTQQQSGGGVEVRISPAGSLQAAQSALRAGPEQPNDDEDNDGSAAAEAVAAELALSKQERLRDLVSCPLILAQQKYKIHDHRSHVPVISA